MGNRTETCDISRIEVGSVKLRMTWPFRTADSCSSPVNPRRTRSELSSPSSIGSTCSFDGMSLFWDRTVGL